MGQGHQRGTRVRLRTREGGGGLRCGAMNTEFAELPEFNHNVQKGEGWGILHFFSIVDTH